MDTIIAERFCEIMTDLTQKKAELWSKCYMKCLLNSYIQPMIRLRPRNCSDIIALGQVQRETKEIVSLFYKRMACNGGPSQGEIQTDRRFK
jgi:hypothetical protein